MAPTSNTTTTTTTTSKPVTPKATSSDTSTTATLHLSANFAADEHKSSPVESPGSIGYDHEVYLQLTAGGDRAVEKTPNQVYREERAQHRRSRALDPAIFDPQGDPSPIDFECAEISQLKSGPESRSKGS